MSFFGKTAKAAESVVPEADRIPIGVVGVGQMGRHHARILSTLGPARLVGIADLNLEKARELGKGAWGPGVPVRRRISAGNPRGGDCGSHAGPPRSGPVFFGTGWHCFVEKPLTERVEDAEDIISLAREKNLVLASGPHRAV
jgi:UDP-N-acetylglucosamine 3-dehydrogenase